MVKALLPHGESRDCRWDLAGRLEDDLREEMPSSIFCRLSSSLEVGAGVITPQGELQDLEKQIRRLRDTDASVGAEWLEITDLAAFALHHQIPQVTIFTDGKPDHTSVIRVCSGPSTATEVTLLFSLGGHYERLEPLDQDTSVS